MASGGSGRASLSRLALGYAVVFAIAAVTAGIAAVVGFGVPGAGSGSAEAATMAAGCAPVHEPRSAEETFGRLMLAIAVAMIAARLLGALMPRLSQPRVIGEVIAGIVLGPSLLGLIAPGVRCYVFPPDIVPLLGGAADIGLAFYMFLVGLELDATLLRGRIGQTALISNAGVAVPMALGLLVAVPLFPLLGTDAGLLPFMLFMGVAMSITAFPVLARILVERRMLNRPIGAIVLGAAAVDDVTAWGLLAFASAVATSGGEEELPLIGLASGATGLPSVPLIVAFAALFAAAMLLVVRRLLRRVSVAYEEAGYLSPSWMGTILAGVLVSAFVAQQIGVAAIFGAFLMGVVMPRHAGLTREVTHRLEDFVVAVLLPLFFVVTGLRTQAGLLDSPLLWLIALLLLATAVVAKWGSTMFAARITGLSLRESTAVGALMNTRGLTELIVLNIALQLGVISSELFAMLVLVALATTLMSGPALRLIDPRGTMSAPAEETLKDAQPASAPGVVAPERAILVGVLNESNLEPLVELGAALTRTTPPRELVLVRLIRSRRMATGLSAEQEELAAISRDLDGRRERLAAAGVSVRSVAFTSAHPGEDLVRLATREAVDLLVVDGRRPLIGEGVPRGSTGRVLRDAPCDVAVLVNRGGPVLPAGGDRPIVVPFGGASHDWTALELGAWLAAASNAQLRLVGSAGYAAAGADAPSTLRPDQAPDASRLLANASLVVQRLTGLTVEPHLVEPGREGVLSAAGDAALLVVGLGERWREEGLGPVRSALARHATAPILFVRSGRTSGALTPAGEVTRFPWSTVRAPR